MTNISDKQYYSAFFPGDVSQWDSATAYFAGDVVSYLGDTWVAQADNTDSTPTSQNANWEVTELGLGQFITLEDIINNYMVAYADDDTHGNSSRYKVEYFAQRAVQEFNYDMFTVKSQEFQPNRQDLPLWPMPKDFVSLVKISWVDAQGVERPLIQRSVSGNPTSPLQTGTGNFIYDENGNITYASSSVEQARWNARTTSEYNPQYAGSQSDGSYGFGYQNIQGQRYYLNPETANKNGTYNINHESGTVSFDFVQPIAGQDILTIYYVTDGLSNDYSEVKVHKFAEKAIYEDIYSEIIDKRRDVPANEKQKATKKAMATKRNAKLKLAKWGHRELLQTLRGIAKWIKT